MSVQGVPAYKERSCVAFRRRWVEIPCGHISQISVCNPGGAFQCISVWPTCVWDGPTLQTRGPDCLLMFLSMVKVRPNPNVGLVPYKRTSL